MVSTLSVADPFYSQSYVPWEAEFIASDPFAYHPISHQTTGTVASGTQSLGKYNVTISGTAFAEPKFTVRFVGQAAGNTTVSGLVFEHIQVPTYLTVSGLIPYSSDVIVTYSGLYVTVSGVRRDFGGAFSRWEPGVNTFNITVTSGNNPGFNWTLEYQPRYF